MIYATGRALPEDRNANLSPERKSLACNFAAQAKQKHHQIAKLPIPDSTNILEVRWAKRLCTKSNLG